ncbi:peptide deformylase [Ruminococcus sp.]|uniref:peptide deformylase n=1 Tax=Ruminococcus sp. TaxID=41978 RepID=UPI0025E8CCA3|nr:peptide deformylase [Ruminococcus sp.]
MIREIVTDPIFLSQKSEPATKNDQQTIRDLLDTIQVNADRCVGMAANMIGVRKTILVAQIGKEYLIMVNPKIVDYSKQSYDVEEGCLSLSGQRLAKRYRIIVVEYLDRKFKKKKRTFKDFEAQIIQHEIDHFEGILI